MKTFTFPLQYTDNLEMLKREHRILYTRRVKLEVNNIPYMHEAQQAGELMNRIMDIENGFKSANNTVISGIYRVTIERTRKKEYLVVCYNENDEQVAAKVYYESWHTDLEDLDLRTVTKKNFYNIFRKFNNGIEIMDMKRGVYELK